nr:acyltransferase [uncultured Alistipes sp.]
MLRHQTFRPRARPPARHDVRHPYTSVSLPDHIRRGGGEIFHDAVVAGLFVSATPFWFMRTYLCLYLISPVINLFLSHSNTKQRLALLCVLAFISHYLGSAGFDPSLAGGKNLVTFLFLYAAGDTLCRYRNRWQPLHRTCGRCWCGLNIGLVLLFTFWTSRTANALYSRVWFSYCSFGLLVNALLFFVWIGGLRFHSPRINRIARSSLAIYLIHGAPFVALHVIEPFVQRFICPIPHRSLLLGAVLLMTLDIVAACVAIDHLLNPVWRRIDCLGMRLQTRWNRLNCTYFTH